MCTLKTAANKFSMQRKRTEPDSERARERKLKSNEAFQAEVLPHSLQNNRKVDV